MSTGRIALRLDGVVTSRLPRGITPAVTVVGAALQRGRVIGATPNVVAPFRAVTIRPHRSVFLVLRYATACETPSQGNVQLTTDNVRFRYTYLHVFHRTQTVELPYALTVQCGGKLPASTPVP